MGDCTVNLAYYANVVVTDIKVKKQLGSTNDKKAALYYSIQLNDKKE